ncbi:MAG: ABC transporter permease [Treponema sp.]|jgi:ABC-type dipeptide/oligopeptide/nickel transport system permease component|nr:ABC transporter permease [Treponema sp.]
MRFLGARLIITLLTLLLVSMLTFAAFTCIPGDPVSLALGIEATDEQIATMRAELGLDRSLPVRYGLWLGRFLTGNWGNSVRFRGAAIADMVRERLPVTSTLAFLALFFIIIIAIPTALLAARREGSFLDRAVSTLTPITISFPGFFLGVLFIWVFGLILKCFTPGAYVSYQDNFGGFLRYLLFPALAIALPNAAVVIKFLRGSLLQQLRSDYVRTAYSKGASQTWVLYHHVLKNAFIPALTVLGMIIGEIFSGSIVIEQVFTIPGIGRLLIASITSRDYPLIQTLVVYIACMVILANTLVDIGIQWLDPRIRVRSCSVVYRRHTEIKPRTTQTNGETLEK